MAKRPKPLIGDVERMVKDGVSYYSGRDERNIKWRDMYNNEHVVGLPKPPKGLLVQPYRMASGKGPEIIDAAHSVFGSNDTYSIDTPGFGSRIASLTERVEKFANAAPGQIEFECGESTNDLVTFDVLLYGYSGVKVLPYPQAWGKLYPDQGAGEDVSPTEGSEAYNSRVAEFTQTAPLPIRIWHTPAATLLSQLDGRKVVTHLERKFVTPSWLLSHYGRQLNPDDLSYLRKVGAVEGTEGAGNIEFVEYADDTYCGWFSFGNQGFRKELKIWPHRMPLPENQAPSVFYEGLTTGDPRPKFRWKSLLTDIYDAIQGQDFALSQTGTAALIYYYLTVFLTLGENESPDQDIETLKASIQFGGPNVLLPGRKFDVLSPPNPLPDIDRLSIRTAELIEHHWPSILSGQTPPGRSTGYMVQLVRDSALAVKQAIPKHLAQGGADKMRMVFYAVGGLTRITGRKDLKVYARNVRTAGGDPVYVTWDDVKDMIPLTRAERKPTLPIDEQNQLDTVGKAISLGMAPPRAWSLYGDIEDPETMEEEARAWRVEHSPPLDDQFTQEVIAKLGLKRNQQEGLDMAAAAALNLPPAVQEGLGIPPSPLSSEPVNAPMASNLIPPPMATPLQPVPMETGGTVRAPRGAGRRIGDGARSGSKTRPKGPRVKPPTSPGGAASG